MTLRTLRKCVRTLGILQLAGPAAHKTSSISGRIVTTARHNETLTGDLGTAGVDIFQITTLESVGGCRDLSVSIQL